MKPNLFFTHPDPNLQSPALRYSLALCGKEKYFRSKRKEKVMQAMQKMFGTSGPRSLRQTPTIAILGSGGGFRSG